MFGRKAVPGSSPIRTAPPPPARLREPNVADRTPAGQRADLLPQGEILEVELIPGLAGCSEQADEEGQEEDNGLPQSGRSVTSRRPPRNGVKPPAGPTSGHPSPQVGSCAKCLILKLGGIMGTHTTGFSVATGSWVDDSCECWYDLR